MIAVVFVKAAPKYSPFNTEQARQNIKSGQVRLLPFGFAGADQETDSI
jgi:hypothetical protein